MALCCRMRGMVGERALAPAKAATCVHSQLTKIGLLQRAAFNQIGILRADAHS